jgi:alpha-tubulin suppressor-like RCC1 family protein
MMHLRSKFSLDFVNCLYFYKHKKELMNMEMKTILTVVLSVLVLTILGCGNNSGSSATNSTSTVLATGRDHAAFLKSDGTVWSCGNNFYGELGNGITANSSIPVNAAGLSEVIAIAAGNGFTVALKNDGTVWAWGYNSYGELGDNTIVNHQTPVQVQSQETDANGNLLWKTDVDGNPILDANGKKTPILLPFSRVTAIAAGDEFTVALKSDGTVWAWGYNWDGQLGDGTTTSRSMPVRVAGISGVTAISAGGSDTIALKSDGAVWGWGGNYNGELGLGGTWDLSQYTPVQAVGISGVVAIAEGDRTTVVLKNDGTVWTWGANWHGQLGDGTTTDRNTPGQIPGLSGMVAISAGTSSFAVALKNNGTVWAWGAPWYGQLGDGTPPSNNSADNHLTPFQISALSGVTAISAGSGYAVVKKNDSTIWAWGLNSSGQLGDGTTTDRLTPVQVNAKMK